MTSFYLVQFCDFFLDSLALTLVHRECLAVSFAVTFAYLDEHPGGAQSQSQSRGNHDECAQP